ncbi:hypothetical protein [Methylobacterium sp. J-076]|uniref:hypothetical protein n=1 Tax=Methylobacterium sp. J-076 TaxID=2836655 RepID=UPI001FBBAB51|nr:hypothetical protein [Methylobacterium sp. J-076]MCJ2014233.1 hypothetical protein [Methylobacterium sp. J-076]
MTSLAARSPMDRPEERHPEAAPRPASLRRTNHEPCGGAPVLDLALCLILAVAVTGLLLLAL